MLPRCFPTTAALLLLATTITSAVPAPLQARESVDPQCSQATETVTVTKTVLESGMTTPLSVAATSYTVLSEHYSPAVTSTFTAVVAQPSVSREPEPTSPSLEAPEPTTASSESDSTISIIKPGQYRNVVYFTNWGIYGANYQPQQLPADEITHVLYSFADIGSDGEVKSSDPYADLQKHYDTDSWNEQGNNAYGCVKQLYILKKKHRNLKVLLSIGGWTYSPKFAPIAATEAGRQKFASSALNLVKNWGLDGIDIDWEYPSNPTEARNFVLLLKACRQAFDNYAKQHAPGYHFLITIASPAGPTNYQQLDLKNMNNLVDSWNLMAYDYAGSWDTTSGHQANLFKNLANPQSTKFSTDQAVDDYVARGIPSHKISLGLPLYGRSFESTTGVGAPYNGVGAGTSQSGIWLYKDLPRPGATEYYDGVAKASYSYDRTTHELITYDTVASAITKAKYLTQKGLGGAVFWEASGDKTGTGSLVGTMAKQLRQFEISPNLLSYPVSQYDNIRKGMPGS
ncbi:hypothetical protein VTK73DRAFT_9511 [Phialemonium thermophilum]|uniref:chitinase n=1 Tax=Phialemonium thermophilum TaxID=223376 RepID=A0ABR3Y5Y7_9PEZI